MEKIKFESEDGIIEFFVEEQTTVQESPICWYLIHRTMRQMPTL